MMNKIEEEEEKKGSLPTASYQTKLEQNYLPMSSYPMDSQLKISTQELSSPTNKGKTTNYPRKTGAQTNMFQQHKTTKYVATTQNVDAQSKGLDW